MTVPSPICSTGPSAIRHRLATACLDEQARVERRLHFLAEELRRLTQTQVELQIQLRLLGVSMTSIQDEDPIATVETEANA